jgi:hypothetical protein
VTIEVNGVDFVTEIQVNQDGTSLNLWAGRLRSGKASVKGKSAFAIGHKSWMVPLGDGAFIVGPAPSEGDGAAQLVSTWNDTPLGGAFAPYSDPNGYGIKSVLYSGMYDTGELDAQGAPIFDKRSHVVGYFLRPIVGPANTRTIYQPFVQTSGDSWQTKTTTNFDLQVSARGITSGRWPFTCTYYADFQPIQAVFMGANRIAVVSTGQRFVEVDDLNLSTPAPGGGATLDDICGVHTLLSIDGGQTWTAHYTRFVDLGIGPPGFDALRQPVFTSDVSLPQTVCYVGSDTLLAMGISLDGVVDRTTALLRSTTIGQTWTAIANPYPYSPPSYGGLTCLGEGSCGYITRERRDTDPTYYAKPHFYRTTDYGSTWTRTALPEFFASWIPSSLVVTAALKPPSPLPTGKVAADYAQLAIFCKPPATVDTPKSPWRIALSTDGGANWTLGGIVSSSPDGITEPPLPGKNFGMIPKHIPAFPAFPDLHKNGLAIP